ncbi:MAG: hypothetical protein K6E68_03450 [Lachnospiraceae bacterium]|nr:hypothetical protein [Lachnospiraceae bacterium]
MDKDHIIEGSLSDDDLNDVSGGARRIVSAKKLSNKQPASSAKVPNPSPVPAVLPPTQKA